MSEIKFNKYYKNLNYLSLFLVIVSLFLLLFKGLNYGVDFKGGTLIELRINNDNANISQIRNAFNQMKLGNVTVKKFGNDTDYIIKFEKKDSNNANFISNIKKDLIMSLNSELDFRRVENVGPKVSSELLRSGVIAICLSLAAMLICTFRSRIRSAKSLNSVTPESRFWPMSHTPGPPFCSKSVNNRSATIWSRIISPSPTSMPS